MKDNNQKVRRESPERYDPMLPQGMIIAAEHQARYRWAAAAADGKEVLDAGCGAGYGSAILAGRWRCPGRWARQRHCRGHQGRFPVRGSRSGRVP